MLCWWCLPTQCVGATASGMYDTIDEFHPLTWLCMMLFLVGTLPARLLAWLALCPYAFVMCVSVAGCHGCPSCLTPSLPHRGRGWMDGWIGRLAVCLSATFFSIERGRAGANSPSHTHAAAGAAWCCVCRSPVCGRMEARVPCLFCCVYRPPPPPPGEEAPEHPRRRTGEDDCLLFLSMVS